MGFDAYQQEAARTIPDPPAVTDRLIFALGLAGEAGEVCEILKKHHGHGRDLDPTALKAELGDVLWYVAAIATSHGLSLTDIAAFNAAKLRRRYPYGFVTGGGADRGQNADA